MSRFTEFNRNIVESNFKKLLNDEDGYKSRETAPVSDVGGVWSDASQPS